MNGLIPSYAEWKLGIRYTIVILTLALAIWKAGALLVGLLPFMLAFGISELIDPVVRALSRRLRLGRASSSLIVIVILLSGGWTIVAWATVALVQATGGFLDDFPLYRATVVQFVQDMTARISAVFAALPPDIAQWITDNTSQMAEGVEHMLSTLGRSLLGLLRTVPSVLTASILIPLATFFISKDLPAVRKLLWSIVPRTDRNRVGTIIADLWTAAWNYLRAIVILVTFTTLVSTLGLFVVGVDNWFAAGLVIGFLDFLPVVGPSFVFIPWIVYLVIVDNVSLALSLLVIFIIAVGLRSLVEAKVIGDSIGLPPLAILMAMYIGVLLLGVKGAIVGPVTLLLFKAIYKAWKKVDLDKDDD